MSYEGQAAMELESLAGSRAGEPFDMPVAEEGGLLVMNPVPLLTTLGERRNRGDDVRTLAARFHETVIDAFVRVAVRVADAEAIRTVALGGGSFQNARLLARMRQRLTAGGLRVLVPQKLGPNDGAISYGQAAVAAAVLARSA
jgi:hydrogenase maturation protein HypF